MADARPLDRLSVGDLQSSLLDQDSGSTVVLDLQREFDQPVMSIDRSLLVLTIAASEVGRLAADLTFVYVTRGTDVTVVSLCSILSGLSWNVLSGRQGSSGAIELKLYHRH